MQSLRRPFVSPACNALTRRAMVMVHKGDSMANPRLESRLQASLSYVKSSETSKDSSSSMRFVDPRKDSSSSSAAVPKGVSFVSEEVTTSDDSLEDNCRPDLSTLSSASANLEDEGFMRRSIRKVICYACGEEGHVSKLCPRVLAVEPRVSEKTCPCGAGVCRVLTARTLKNSGRQFYKCALQQEEGGCSFFQWCDADSYQHLSKENAPTVKPPVPICPCGAGACSLRTAKTENNKGREFYICPRGQAGCGFFAWRDVMIPVLNATPAHCFDSKTDDHWAEQGSNVSETLNPSILVGAGAQTCFNCGKEGHWAKDCPARPFSHIGRARSGGSDSYKGETGGMFSGIHRGSPPSSRRDIGVVMERSDRCFKCGMRGHWSKLCPNV